MKSCALTLLSKVSPLCPISFPQAPFEVPSEKQALLRVIHGSKTFRVLDTSLGMRQIPRWRYLGFFTHCKESQGELA